MLKKIFNWQRYAELLDEIGSFDEAGQMGHWLVDRPLLELLAMRRELMLGE